EIGHRGTKRAENVSPRKKWDSSMPIPAIVACVRKVSVNRGSTATGEVMRQQQMRSGLAAGKFAIARLLVLAAASLGVATVNAAEQPLKSGIDRATFDTSIKPGDDFFQYVNGQWIKENPIPAEYSRWGAFPKLHDDNLVALRGIVE